MLRIEDECVGCPPEMGCIGSACENKNVPHLYCDECGDDADILYLNSSGERVCKDCLLKDYKSAKFDDIPQGDVCNCCLECDADIFYFSTEDERYVCEEQLLSECDGITPSEAVERGEL